MLKKIISKLSLRFIGILIIFLFSFSAIWIGFVRNLDETSLYSRMMAAMISMETKYYDYRMNSLLDPTSKSKQIALVKIDDYSLQKLGVWPIPRTVYAQMLDKLRVFGAKVVAMDILFPEKSPGRGDVSPDEVLAKAIKDFQESTGGRIYIGYNFAEKPSDALNETPIEMYDDLLNVKNVNNTHFIPRYISKFSFPIQEFVQAGVGIASINSEEDWDGVFRHYQLINNINTDYFGSLAFNSFTSFSGMKYEITVSKDKTGLIKINNRDVEITENGEVKIRYAGSWTHFPTISLYDLINASDDNSEFKNLINGKIIYIGSTAMGAHDMRHSPIDPQMPGVFSHMNMTQMLIDQNFFKPEAESIKISIYLLLFSMIIFFIVQRKGNAYLDTAVISVIMIGYYYADKFYFLPQGYEIKLFYNYFCLFFSYSWNTFHNFNDANREKKQIRNTFARYVAPTIVEEMLKDPDNIQVGGVKMDITCLFSDVRDFTSISEGLTATELSHSLNLYMGEMTDIVLDSKGTLDKYIGDAIVAIWGAPVQIGNHAQYAVEAAIKMMNTLPSINKKFQELNRPQFNIGIGLNSGECSVGNMGSSRIFSYTALGDNMNLGARLESLCKHYGVQILISEETLKRLDLTNIKTRPVDKVIVKGKTLPVEIFEVLHDNHWLSKDAISLEKYLNAYKFLKSKNFQGAGELLDEILKVNENDVPSKGLLLRCHKYIDNPELVSDLFDVTIMKEK